MLICNVIHQMSVLGTVYSVILKSVHQVGENKYRVFSPDGGSGRVLIKEVAKIFVEECKKIEGAKIIFTPEAIREGWE